MTGTTSGTSLKKEYVKQARKARRCDSISKSETITDWLTHCWHCTAATFHYVSVSKPNPVWFGKKSSNYWQTFPNQIQFGLEKKCWTFQQTKISNQFLCGLEIFVQLLLIFKHFRHFDQLWKCGNIKVMSCLVNRGQKVKAEIGSKCTRKRWKLSTKFQI